MTDCLDMDMGNSRTKWKCGVHQGVLPRGKLPKLTQAVGRVRVASVLHDRDDLAERIAHEYGVEAEFAESTLTLAGVTNAYARPATLGVDRWLALVAGWNRMQSAVTVVDCGTAMTIDIVDDDGSHMGGFIVPGIECMRESLANSTSHVQLTHVARSQTDLLPGTSTQDAVQRGLLLMAISWIERCKSLADEVCGSRSQGLLLGGGSRMLSDHLDSSFKLADDLVLEGLKLALP